HYIKAIPNETGIYLISKKTVNSVPTLDVSFISEEELDGTESTITPKQLYSFKNNDPKYPGVTPVPDSQLFDVLTSGTVNLDGEVIIGASDYQGSIVTWYINPDGSIGQKTLISKATISSDFPRGIRNLIFNDGNCQGDETGVNDISASIYQDTTMLGETNQLGDGLKSIYSCDGPSFESNTWNRVYRTGGDKEEYFMGKGALSKFTLNVPMWMSENLWSIQFFGLVYNNDEDDPNCHGYTFYLGYFASNQLIQNPDETTNSTSSNFDGNAGIFIPQGFVDGVPPFSMNGRTMDNCDIDSGPIKSEVDLSNGNSKSTEISGSRDSSGSISLNLHFVDLFSGIDASYERGAKEKTTKESNFETEIEQTLNGCEDPATSYGYFLYLAPNMVTTAYNVADYFGTIPTSNPKVVYISVYDPSDPLKPLIKSYNLTNPVITSQVFKGMASSPDHFNLNPWYFSSWSGGWNGRDWIGGKQNPYAGNYVSTLLGSEDLTWDSGGGTGTPTYTMDNASTISNEHTQKTTVSVDILGLLKPEGYITTEQDISTTNTFKKGLTFKYDMRYHKGDTCGYNEIDIEPQLLTPVKNPDGSIASCPWVPSIYAAYQPWFLTWHVVSTNGTDCSSVGMSTATENVIATSIVPVGGGTITLPSGEIEVNATGQIKAVPADGYTFMYWKGMGLDLDDLSSPVTNVTVRADHSTIRAYFAKESSSLVDTGIIAVRNDSVGNQVKLQGTLPDGFNKYMALHPRKPIEIRVGFLTFPFGSTVGDVTIVSDHEIAYTTNDPKKGVSSLRLDLGKNKWWFAANQVPDLNKELNSHILTIEFEGKNTYKRDSVLMGGYEDIMWSGKNESVSNDLFSLNNATVSGKVYYYDDNKVYDRLSLNGGGLKVSSVLANDPVTLKMNDVVLAFDNATSVDGNVFSYQYNGKDLNGTITINNATKSLNVAVDGERLSHEFIRSAIPIKLQVGTKNASAIIHATPRIFLRTPHRGSIDEDAILSGSEYGV
ncbi:MAG TPA: hypothetical protein VN429_04490, partial [Methanospirillum sp.]|uniref:InlB B-repeat-containing protein n=1 Tax=Methanospirillum sp. TaxID=45200 RepID=UPI002C54CB09